MSNAKAIVTLTIGKSFQERWQKVCRPNWQIYAERHGYDLICIDEPLDDSPRARQRSPAWQKCLILGQDLARGYERIVWIDADVLINPSSPDIAYGVPLEQVGAVDEYATPTPELYRLALRKLYEYWDNKQVAYIDNLNPADYYARWGLPSTFGQVVQTGVMVLSPQHHRQLLEDVYAAYEDKGPAWNYEMRPLSYELLKAGCVHWLDRRFNYLWGIYKALYFPFLSNNPTHALAEQCVNEGFAEVYCLHFAGSVDEMALVHSDEAKHAAESQVEARPTWAIRTPPERESRLTTPVVVIIYARPDTTEKLFAVLRQVKPAQLYVIADAPRAGREDEIAKCASAREVFAHVDWDCRVLTNYAETHLGIKGRVESGLDWVFNMVGEAIILEDDCLPDPTFFRYCQELLARYRDEPRVMGISGNNFQFGQNRTAHSYYFSRYPHIWGWATWRRAWRRNDPRMSGWPELRARGWLQQIFQDAQAVKYWDYVFQTEYEQSETWDYAWLLTCWSNRAWNILPNVNLVSNLGFRPDGTHGGPKREQSIFSHMLTEPMSFPLYHPLDLNPNQVADDFTEDIMYSGNLTRLFGRIRAYRQKQRSATP